MTKMNNQSNTLNEDSINQYGGYVSDALANIEEMRQTASKIQSQTQTLYLCAEDNRKKKIYLNEILVSLEKQQIKSEPNEFLNDVQVPQKRQFREVISFIESDQEIEMPNINLPDISWASSYLQQIKQQNFQKVKDMCNHQRQNIIALTNNHKRYSTRLIEIEQKLKKCYQEARSKKRYI